MDRVYFKTFGCRTNQFDTQVMISKLNEYKVTLKEDEADIVVVNSCTVTNGADVSVRSYINSLKKRKPNIRVILTGCGAFSKGESLLANNSVNGVFGHSEKSNINSFLKKDNFFELGDLNSIDETIVSDFIGKSRAFIKIQEGCDFACSYCIIPSVRGGARSHDESTIVEQVSKLANNGFGEFILTGTNVGSYGKDKGTTLAKLIKKLSFIRGVRRIRVGSIEPIQIDSEFMELLDEPFMAKHLHIAIQHSSDSMLEIMNRRNRVASDLELFETIASKGYAIGTDYIVGHPCESSDIWLDAIENIKKYPLTHIHAFTYSKRDNTASANMKDIVNGKIAKERYNELINIIKDKNRAFRESCKAPLEVLVESNRGDIYTGLDQYFNKLEIKSSEDIKSNWISVDKWTTKESINYVNFEDIKC
jgi:MiaB-like tRNA modifying enzyme